MIIELEAGIRPAYSHLDRHRRHGRVDSRVRASMYGRSAVILKPAAGRPVQSHGPGTGAFYGTPPPVSAA